MVTIISSNGEISYGINIYLCDTLEDLKDIPKSCGIGSKCTVLETQQQYILNSKRQWVVDTTASSGEGTAVDLTGYATEDFVNNAIKNIQHPTVDLNGYIKTTDVEKMFVAFKNQYRPIKYEITSAPKGTLIDYREKEIRVMCPANTVFEKQNVGPTGNANMYYMGFKAYAPEGAVSFKEGDRGVIVDEMFDFTGSFAGTDQYGRNYSIIWLALASYDADSDSWTYYGASSSTEKYIGWTYIVEWYNADGTIISADKIRINLSNEDCHLNLAPYYGTV